MKKILTVLMVLTMVLSISIAKGQEEDTIEIIWLTSEGAVINEDATKPEMIVRDFLIENPEVTVKRLQIDLSDGSTMHMDALIAAGMAPDVYNDFLGRAGKYMNPDFALDLSKYHTDLDDYLPGTLDAFRNNGALLGLPQPGGYQGMCINLDLANELGLDIPVDVTIEQFLNAAGKVKSGKDATWITGMFAANQSGDYLIMNWFASFGAVMYEPGYSASAVNSVEGLKTIEFWKKLYDKGYIQKESAVLSDDDYALYWARGQYLATAFYPSWCPIYFKVVKEQGLGEGFDYKFTRFPRAPGVKKVPTAGSFPGLVVKASDNEERNKLSARLAWHINNAKFQEMQVLFDKGYTNRKSVTAKLDDPYWNQIDAIFQENGYFDLGLALPCFSEIRAQMYPQLQQLFTGKKTPAEVLADYEKNVNEILNQ